MARKYGEDPTTHPITDPDIWVGATGETQKGRLYGFGDREHADVILGTRASASPSTSQRRRQEVTPPLAAPNMEEIGGLIQRRMEEAVPRLRAAIAEDQSLRGPMHQLDHDVIGRLISDTVQAEMATIRAEFTQAAVERDRWMIQIMDRKYSRRVEDLSPRDNGDNDDSP